MCEAIIVKTGISMHSIDEVNVESTNGSIRQRAYMVANQGEGEFIAGEANE